MASPHRLDIDGNEHHCSRNEPDEARHGVASHTPASQPCRRPLRDVPSVPDLCHISHSRRLVVKTPSAV